MSEQEGLLHGASKRWEDMASPPESKELWPGATKLAIRKFVDRLERPQPIAWDAETKTT